MILEPKLVYRTARGEVPDGEHVVPLGKARLAREGTDLTLVAYGAMVPVCERAADELDASVEVLDLRSLKPLDEEALLASAAKTGRVVLVQEAPRTCGYAAELAAILAEKALLDLQAPVLRVTGYDVPYPVLADRGRVHAVGRARRRRGAQAARVLVAMHELPLDPPTCTATSRASSSRCSTVDPGDSVRIAVPNAGWRRRPRRARRRRRDPSSTPAMRSPGRSRCAAPGRPDARRAIDEVVPGPWGATFTRAAAPDRLGARRTASAAAAGRAVRLAPFLGVLGMPPDEPGVHSTIPPRRCGGNIDCKELVAGTTLFLPIPVDGALFSAGDGHAAQGDGEVSGTAIEAPVEATLTLDVRDDLPLEWPVARIDGAWLTFGFDEHLGRAARIAVDGMLDLMEREHGLSRPDALGLASVVVDLRVTQVVNEVLGVHAVLRDDAFL